MSKDVTIFSRPGGAVADGRTRRQSALAQTLASASTYRAIQTNTNGTFRKLLNGEPVGNAIRGELNAVIVNALPRVSRVFYAGAYDPKAAPTLPDCWSNDGEEPELAVSKPQAQACVACPQNVKGSSDNGGRACRFRRNIALLLEGDDSGDIYRFGVPAQSLFGKGIGNSHPFENYIRFLISNGESPDTVVTNISYDLEADTMKLVFTPVRILTPEEETLVAAAQANPESKDAVVVVSAAALAGAAAKANTETVQAKVVAQATAAKAELAGARTSAASVGDTSETEEPQVRKRAKPAVPSQVPVSKNMAAILADWDVEDQ